MKKGKVIRKGLAAIIALSMLSSTVVIANNSSEESYRQIASSEMQYETNSEHVGAEIYKAFDNNTSTFWDSAWEEGDKGLGETPIEIVVEFNEPQNVTKMEYTPRQDYNLNGMILKYNINAIDAIGDEITLVSNGTWDNDASMKEAVINHEEKIQSITIEILEGSLGGGVSATAATAAEFSFYETVKVASMSQDALAVNEGEAKSLEIVGYENDAVTWTTSNQSVAEVNEDGLVTGVAEGTALITGVTEDNAEAICTVSVSATVAPLRENMVLVFEDNFDGDSLDSSKWNNWCVDLKEEGLFRYGNSPDITVHPDNVEVADGTLRLLGTKEDTTFDSVTSSYRSAMVQTRDIFEPTYGYLEVMVKFADVAGTNPAVWTMPTVDEENGGWLWGDADNFGAEIDILERPHPEGSASYAGLDDQYWITMHYDNYEFTNHTKYHAMPELENPYEWHTFGMYWTEESIEFLLDGEVVATQTDDVPNMAEILILSYGMGGWIGEIADEDLPAVMEVDYVRWYQDMDDVTSETKLNVTEAELEVAEELQLEAITVPENADIVESWVSSNDDVATVSDNGLVKAISSGTATITMTTIKGDVSTCVVTVTDVSDGDGDGDADGNPDGNVDGDGEVGNPDANEDGDGESNPNVDGDGEADLEDPDAENGESEDADKENPKTGDNARVLLIWGTMIASFTAILVLPFIKKLKKGM